MYAVPDLDAPALEIPLFLSPAACGFPSPAQAKQQIICSRSFGERITQIGPMHQALAGYMERAAEKLREEGMCCRHVTLFIRTSPFSDKAPYYGNQVSTKLAMPTNDTRALLALIPQLLPASGVMSNVIRRAASCWPNSHRPTCGRATCSQWSSNHRAARR